MATDQSRVQGGLSFLFRLSEPGSLKIILLSGSSLFSVGNLVRRAQPRSAALRLLKVESGINGILPAGGGPLPFIPFLS